MKAKSKKKTFNIIMVALIALIVLCGIMAVGNLKGWFGGNDDSQVVSGKITGIVNVERSDVAYALEESIPMEDGDLVETKSESEVQFAVGKNGNMTLGSQSEMHIDTCQKDDIELTLGKSRIFAEIPELSGKILIAFGNSKAKSEGATFSVDKQEGSAELCVFNGNVNVDTANDGQIEVKPGKKLVISNDSGKNQTTEIQDIEASSLSDFQITKLKSSTSDICFTSAQLEKVVNERKAEKEKQATALEQEALAEVSGDSNSGGSSSDSATSAVMTCTIQIQCKSILSHMDKLKEGKDRYVPSGGTVLSSSKVEFTKGESAYDVTKRACNAAGIQIEAAYTPAYGGYYVEGINHLYEFDCGQSSGWMYQINGWAPNYGCSEYTLKNGDSIVWYYTCTGN